MLGEPRCKSCESLNLNHFSGELALHFRGLEGLNKPIVWVFPQVVVCLDCGLAEFQVPQEQLAQLSKGGSRAQSA